jgi:hypothetical protein
MRPFFVASACLLLSGLSVHSEMIPVIQRQGAMHGFLVMRSPEGKIIATGDQVNVVKGDEVHSRLTFHFRDGSIDDEISVFKQTSTFQLQSDHHIQKGPSFPEPQNISVDVSSGKVTWRESKDGKEKTSTERMDVPPDLANGMISLIVQNFPKDRGEMKVSYLAGTSKPRVVQLSVKPDGEDSCRIGGISRKSERFNIHVEIGGIAGVVAPIVGKQPSDKKVWVLKGEAPTFLKMEGALYLKGPIWSMELASPVWPKGTR